MKSIFRAEDGTDFDTEAECQAHDAILAKSDVIKAWAQETFGPKLAQVTRTTKIATAWERDRATVLGSEA